MSFFLSRFVLAIAILFPALASAQEKKPAGGQPVSFSKQIAPIFLKKCLACHGQRQPKSGYQLHTFAAMLNAGDFGEPPVTPGKPEESLLFQLINEKDKKTWMPKEGDRLPDGQIALVKRWISQGAKFDGKDQKATLAEIAPRQYDAPPDKYRATLPVTALAFNSQGDELAVGGYNEITIWSAAEGKLLRRIKDIAQRTYGLQYSPDGKLLAVASGTPGTRGEVKLLDPVSGKTLQVLGALDDVCCDVAFSPQGDKLAACGADRSIRVFDVASGKQLLLIEDHADWVMSVAFSPDGKRLASASRDKTSKVFDAVKGESQITYNGHGQTVFGVSFSPDGKQVLTSGGDRKIHVWDPANGKKAAEIAGFGNEVYQIELSGGHVFSCSADKTARQHAFPKRNQVRVYSGHADWVYSLAHHQKTERLATGTYNGEVKVFNTKDGKPVVTFVAAPGLEK